MWLQKKQLNLARIALMFRIWDIDFGNSFFAQISFLSVAECWAYESKNMSKIYDYIDSDDFAVQVLD